MSAVLSFETCSVGETIAKTQTQIVKLKLKKGTICTSSCMHIKMCSSFLLICSRFFVARLLQRGPDPFSLLETSLASRWEVPGLPRKFPELRWKFFDDFPGSSLTVELNNNPEVPRKFPRLPRKFPGLPRKFLDLPGGQPLSLRSLTPPPDSQKLSLTLAPSSSALLWNFSCEPTLSVWTALF